MSLGCRRSGLQDDPDGDGMGNYEEFVLGRDGGVAETESGLSQAGEDLAGTFSRRIFSAELGVDMALERSTDLNTWADVPESELTITPLDSQLEMVDFSEALDEQAFFRFRITLP